MKLLPILSTGLFAALAALSFNTQAAEGAEAKAPAAETQTDKVPAKKAKRHSHVEEKTGMAPSEAASASKPEKAKADKAKHFHPRDGK